MLPFPLTSLSEFYIIHFKGRGVDRLIKIRMLCTKFKHILHVIKLYMYNIKEKKKETTRYGIVVVFHHHQGSSLKSHRITLAVLWVKDTFDYITP